MAGKGLQDLGLKDEALPAQSYEDLPEFGGFTPPPQPGAYRFQLPGDLSQVWEVYDYGDKGQRLRMILDKDAPLVIVQSPGGKVNGDTFQTRISNQERKRGGPAGPEASDMDYVLKAFKETTRPKNNKEYATAVLRHAGGEFGADVRYTWFCNPKKNIWVFNAEQKLEEVEGKVGCGANYYQKDQTKKVEQQIERDGEGMYPQQVQCRCGAVVRCFANLDNFRA